MADSLAEQVKAYPLVIHNFRVTRGGASLRCAKVSGLQREYKVLTYRDGLSFLDGEQAQRYNLDLYTTVTLEQGLIEGQHSLYQWLETPKQEPNEQPMEVQLFNGQGMPVLAWRMRKTIPVKFTAPTFDAKANEVVIDVLEIKAAGISMIPLRG